MHGLSNNEGSVNPYCSRTFTTHDGGGCRVSVILADATCKLHRAPQQPSPIVVTPISGRPNQEDGVHGVGLAHPHGLTRLQCTLHVHLHAELAVMDSLSFAAHWRASQRLLD